MINNNNIPTSTIWTTFHQTCQHPNSILSLTPKTRLLPINNNKTINNNKNWPATPINNNKRILLLVFVNGLWGGGGVQRCCSRVVIGKNGKNKSFQ
jgi:hypothetical protein